MTARAFRLRVYPQNEREFGVALDQLPEMMSLEGGKNPRSTLLTPLHSLVATRGAPSDQFATKVTPCCGELDALL